MICCLLVAFVTVELAENVTQLVPVGYVLDSRAILTPRDFQEAWPIDLTLGRQPSEHDLQKMLVLMASADADKIAAVLNAHLRIYLVDICRRLDDALDLPTEHRLGGV